MWVGKVWRRRRKKEKVDPYPRSQLSPPFSYKFPVSVYSEARNRKKRERVVNILSFTAPVT